jgi:hypothetical protein
VEATFSKNSKSESRSHKIIIPAQLARELELLPNKRNNKAIEWATWENEAILKFGKVKSFGKIAQVLSKRETAVRLRYHELIKLRGAK